MAPNLCRCLMTAARPWTWFKNDVKTLNHLHYQSEPVPGIYLIRRKEGRFLVAMKPQGKRQDDKFFKSQTALNEHEAEVYTREDLNSYTSWSINADASALMTTASCTAQSIHSTSSSASEESDSVVDTPKPRKVTFTLPLPEPRRDPYNPGNKVYRKSPLRQCHNAGDEAVKTPSNDPKHGRSRLHRHHEEECPIRSIDSVGFRYLSHPLKVEYSPYLQRWMFSIELQKRTVIAEDCTADPNNQRTNTPCKNCKVQKQFTCLDDGYSWILTGDVGKNGRVKQLKGVTRNSSPLYTMITLEKLRKLSDDEADTRRTRLELDEGRFLRWRGEPEEYVMAIKYVARRGLRRS